MKAIKVAILALLLAALAACGILGGDEDQPAVPAGLMSFTSVADERGLHIKTNYYCDEATGLRSGVSMYVSNTTKADIKVYFAQNVTAAGAGTVRSVPKEATLKPGGEDSYEQTVEPDTAYGLAVYRDKPDGDENRVAYTLINTGDKCVKDRDDGGNDL